MSEIADKLKTMGLLFCLSLVVFAVWAAQIMAKADRIAAELHMIHMTIQASK